MTLFVVAGVVALLLANALFVAVEFGLVLTKRSDLDLHLAGAQLGITMSSLALGALAIPALADALDGPLGRAGAVAAAIVAVVLAHIVVGELVPKHIAIAAPERTMQALSGFDRAYTAALRPVIRAVNGVARAIVRALGVEPRGELDIAHSADELARLLADTRDSGVIESLSHDLLSGALDLGGTRLAAIAVDRADVVSVPITTSVEQAERLAVERGVSRVLVTSREGDDVVGFVHVKDLLTVPAAARRRPLPLARVRRVLVLDRSVRLDTVLLAMRRSRTHVAAVTDVSRQFVGIATLEDVLEELVGDIQDETDLPDSRL